MFLVISIPFCTLPFSNGLAILNAPIWIPVFPLFSALPTAAKAVGITSKTVLMLLAIKLASSGSIVLSFQTFIPICKLSSVFPMSLVDLIPALTAPLSNGFLILRPNISMEDLDSCSCIPTTAKAPGIILNTVLILVAISLSSGSGIDIFFHAFKPFEKLSRVLPMFLVLSIPLSIFDFVRDTPKTARDLSVEPAAANAEQTPIIVDERF